MDAKRLNTLRYELGRLTGAPIDDEGGHWSKVSACVDDLLLGSIQATELALRNELTRFREKLATGATPPNLVPLSRAVDAVLAARGPASKSTSREPTPVERVAALLRGRTILVIGGIPRPEHQANLREAFDLAEVLWPTTQEANPRIDPLAPLIARPEVALALLLIRFIRHNTHDGVTRLCRQYGKPLVKVPGGYNAEQIAPLVLEQRGDELGG